MIGDDLNGFRSTFKVVSPISESFVDGEEFLVVNVVVEFSSGQSSGVERYRMKLRAIVGVSGQNSGDSVVGGISLNNERKTRNEASKDWSTSESFLECTEGFLASVVEDPGDILARESDQRYDLIGVLGNEPSVEIAEAKEGLDILNFLRFGPFENNPNLLRVHSKSGRRQKKSEIVNGVFIKVTLVQIAVKSVSLKSPENFGDEFSVRSAVIGVN